MPICHEDQLYMLSGMGSPEVEQVSAISVLSDDVNVQAGVYNLAAPHLEGPWSRRSQSQAGQLNSAVDGGQLCAWQSAGPSGQQ